MRKATCTQYTFLYNIINDSFLVDTRTVFHAGPTQRRSPLGASLAVCAPPVGVSLPPPSPPVPPSWQPSLVSSYRSSCCKCHTYMAFRMCVRVCICILRSISICKSCFFIQSRIRLLMFLHLDRGNYFGGNVYFSPHPRFWTAYFLPQNAWTKLIWGRKIAEFSLISMKIWEICSIYPHIEVTLASHLIKPLINGLSKYPNALDLPKCPGFTQMPFEFTQMPLQLSD